MKVRTERFASDSEMPINMIRILFSNESQAAITAMTLIREYCRHSNYSAFFTLLPSAIPGQAEQLAKIEGLFFGRWEESFAESWFASRDVEEVVFLLLPKGPVPNERSHGNSSFSTDPYHWIKRAGADGKTISVFFSPWHKDIEFYVPQTLTNSVDSTLKNLGIAEPVSMSTMERYKNRGGDSNVSRYEIGRDSIKVEFADGALYLYDYSKPGRTHVEQMKRLAQTGQGLNRFINTTVRKNYARKLK